MSGSPAFRSEDPERPRVLIVDDDRLGTEVRAELIRLRGLSVDIAFSGNEALAKASNQKFDIFVVDYDMPGMNGLELARELRRHGYGTPIVMLSGRLEPPTNTGAELLARFISKGEGAGVLLEVLIGLLPGTLTRAITAQPSAATLGV